MADPVADFLAREQDMLAEIDGAPTPPAGIAADATPPVPTADEFGAMAVGPPLIGGADSGVDLVGMDYQATPSVPLVNGNGVNSQHSAASSKGTSPVPSLTRVEAENIRRWREQQKILLEKKDEAEEKRKNELRNMAKKELEEWYKQRDAALKLTKEANRKAEEEHLAAFGREQGEGAQWDEIARLCEAKSSAKRRKRQPSADELLELVEKQDVLIDCLLQKLEMRDCQVQLLREFDSTKERFEREKGELISDAQRKVSSALTAVDMLHVENEKLVKELDELQRKNNENKPVSSIVQLQNRVKELEFELLREQRSSSNLQADIDFQKMRIEQLQSEIDTCTNEKVVTVSSLSSKLEHSIKELAELRVKYNSLLDDRESTSTELSTLVEVLTHRSDHLQAHCDVLSAEVVKLRGECKTAESRVATLVEENAALRKRLMQNQTKSTDEDQVQRLLTDQSLLICALREEGRLLMNQLEVERKDNRVKWSSLKKENKKLEERLKRLIST